MAARYAKHFGTKVTPQNEPIPGKTMVPNSAGGYVFPVDDFTRLDRFLILGTEGGTYYASEQKLTVENAQAVLRCIQADGRRTVSRIVEISETGRAPKNDAAVFALAMCAGLGDADTRKYALASLSKVCRIGTHLFQFNEAVEQFRGRGKGLNKAVARWYTEKTVDNLAYQMVKYQQRGGWSHRDLLRLTKPHRPDLDPLFRWCVKAGYGERYVKRLVLDKDGKWMPHRVAHYPEVEGNLPKIVEGFELAKTASSAKDVAGIISRYNLPREAVPTQFLTSPEVWEALLENMPPTALIRNLATMTRVGLIAPMSMGTNRVISVLASTDRLKKARVHPVAVLIALKTYAAGRGERGQNTWNPVPQVVDALDGAFYHSFASVEPTGKRWLIALDVSGSMGSSMIAGVPNFTAREASAAMALVLAATEKNHAIVGFTGQGFQVNNHRSADEVHAGWGMWSIGWANQPSGCEPLNISPRQRLDDAVKAVANLPMGPTDCALPMLYAQNQNMPVDVFCLFTDNETWCGAIHPTQALQQYRDKTGIPAKLVVNAMTATGFGIADPNDGGMLDVCGLDANVPIILNDFAKA